ncbi:MAG TPA: ATP-dependent DNA helicase DinG [Rhodanobacteraceae bacterium]|nr:ATP-dependent DNA helicase DinG [Rhodanobacteraceae bacterium]
MLADATKDAIRAAYARLKEGLPGFRTRAAQGRMIAQVARTFAEDGGIAAVEAPTGTGKSMAYLIPGLELARARKKRLLIASATVALQEQLVQRDIPRFLAINGTPARVALAKGRTRYVCPRDLGTALASLDAPTQGGLDFDAELAVWSAPPGNSDRQALATLGQVFADGSWNGDLDAAPAEVSETLRPVITTSAGGCSGRKCPHFMACPFFAARRAVDDAEIIVANQDLLLSDLTMPREEGAWGGLVLPLPDETLYVIDEAHRLPGKAIERGAAHVALAASMRRLPRLGRQVRAAYSLTEKERIGRLDLAQGDELLRALGEALQALDGEIRLAWTPDPKEAEPVYRASLGELPAAWVEHARELEALTARVWHWLSAVRRAVVDMTERGPAQAALSRALGLALEQVGRQALTWQAWSAEDSGDGPPLARWVSLGHENQRVCHASAVSAAPLLRQVLWGNANGVLLTSATLTSGGSFREYAEAVGLPDAAATLALPSPFDLQAQARLEVPAMRNDPSAREAHADEVADWLSAHLDWDAGNLVLFTSRRKLERVLQRLPLAQVRKVRAQGERNKAQLLAEHAAAVEAGSGSTLFGLTSFGEGLDLPGKLCETVVVTQLPFAVPTDPVEATYAEWLEAQGRNPFLEVSVPAATRLLTQYCGRLIRNETDHGRIVLLDRRAVRKRYGERMLRALPPFRRVIEQAVGA